jgi:hypothetical protein
MIYQTTWRHNPQDKWYLKRVVKHWIHMYLYLTLPFAFLEKYFSPEF